jgi:hypothetical protein
MAVSFTVHAEENGMTLCTQVCLRGDPTDPTDVLGGSLREWSQEAR